MIVMVKRKAKFHQAKSLVVSGNQPEHRWWANQNWAIT